MAYTSNGNGTAVKMETDVKMENGSAADNSEPMDKRKVFVGGLTNDTTEDDLKTYFSQYGSVVSCILKRDPASGRSRGFAFVTFGDSATMRSVVAMTTHQIKGKKIDPKPAEPRPGEEPILKVFVGGIDTNMSDDELKTYFEKFGPVKNIEWPKDRLRDNAKKNYAFIEFDDEKIVNEIIKNSKQTIGGKPCDVKRALPTQPKQPGGGGRSGGWGDYGSPYGSYQYGAGGGGGGGGYGGGAGGGYGGGAGGGYGDQYGGGSSYYGGGQGGGYEQGGYYDNAGGYGGYDTYGGGAGGYDYGAAGGDYGGAGGYGAGAGYGGGRGGGRGASRGASRGAPAGGRGASRGAAPSGRGGRGASRGYHPYAR